MNFWDYAIIIALAVILFFVIRYLIKRKKKGGSLTCSSCSKNCIYRNTEYSCDKKAEKK